MSNKISFLSLIGEQEALDIQNGLKGYFEERKISFNCSKKIDEVENNNILIILINNNSYELLEKINTYTKNIVFVVDVEDMPLEVSLDNDNLIYLSNPTKSFELLLPLLRILVGKMVAEGLESFDTLNENLNEVMLKSLQKLEEIKKLHKQIVPIRYEQIKGVHFTSKYHAGLSSGSEFLDIINKKNRTILVLTSSSSYTVTSFMLTRFTKLRLEKDISQANLENFIIELFDKLEQESRPKKGKNRLEVLLLDLDYKNMQVSGYNIGDNKLISPNINLKFSKQEFDKESISSHRFEIALTRGEQLLIISPGFSLNSKGFIDGQGQEKYIRSLMKNDSYEILNELFFQIKKDSDDEFLEFDSTLVDIRVAPNAIIQI
jgi:hypothetical protein